MSWLTDLAGKAEDFLNKVDKSAAVAFQQKEEELLLNSAALSPESQSLAAVEVIPSGLQQNQSRPSPVRKLQPKIASKPESPVKVKPLHNTKDDDEKLFEFLNSPDTIVPKREKSSSPEANNTNPESHSTRVSPLSFNGTGGSSHAKVDGTIDYLVQSSADTMATATVNIESDPTQHLSGEDSLVLENRLLRNEVSSLNQEMSQVLQRAKDAEGELGRLRKNFENYNSHASQSDRIIKELQDREADQLQALDAKDSQLAVLRVRLQEADQQNKLKQERLQKLEGERSRILQDHTDSSGLHNHALQLLREKVEENENVLEKERSQFKMMQNEFNQRISKLEDENQNLSSSLVELQNKLGSEKNRITDLTSQTRTAKSNLDSARQELTDYKQKAQKILQSKEKLIATLKEAGSANIGDAQFETATIAAGVELEEVRQERDMLREELQEANANVLQLRSEIQDVESQLQSELELSQEQQRNLEEQLRTEGKLKQELIQENVQMKEELQYMREEASRQKSTHHSRVQDRENEIEKLRKQLTVKMMNNSQSELESRLHALTESLIQKQTMLEALSTEKSSLVLQLERLEQQLKENQSYTRRGNATAVSLTDDSGKGRMPSFLLESPFDGRVARKVKRAYNTLDTFSVRLGVFLRRYPIARIMVITYMVLLHLWVFTVLLTYTPEIHTGDMMQPNTK